MNSLAVTVGVDNLDSNYFVIAKMRGDVLLIYINRVKVMKPIIHILRCLFTFCD